MRQVFMDTVAWIALLNASDDLHAPAEAVYSQLRQDHAKLVTTEFVLLEVADALSAPAIRTRTIAALNGLRQTLSDIVPISSELYSNAWALYSNRPDKGWGLTDCTSFVVMEQLQITEAFTLDQHFTQAGFTCLL